jgi:hypothetical protein
MVQEGGDELVAWRNHVSRAHEQVLAGRYAEAVRAFGEAVGPLTRLLGADHPEVAELVDDIDAAASMGDIAAFVDEAGFRYGPPRPKP